MQLAPFATSVVREDPPAPLPTKTDAAKALIAVPMGATMVASMTAMGKAMSGQPASRADLLAQFVAQLPPANVYLTIANAIDGAVAVAPELAPKNDALRAAAQGVANLLAASAADTVQGPAMDVLAKFSAELQTVATPLFEAALYLDPTLANPKPQD